MIYHQDCIRSPCYSTKNPSFTIAPSAKKNSFALSTYRVRSVDEYSQLVQVTYQRVFSQLYRSHTSNMYSTFHVAPIKVHTLESCRCRLVRLNTTVCPFVSNPSRALLKIIRLLWSVAWNYLLRSSQSAKSSHLGWHQN